MLKYKKYYKYSIRTIEKTLFWKLSKDKFVVIDVPLWIFKDLTLTENVLLKIIFLYKKKPAFYWWFWKKDQNLQQMFPKFVLKNIFKILIIEKQVK